MGWESVGDQIRALRKERRLTQAELATRLGKSVRLVALWESAEYDRHTMATLTRIAAAFGLVPQVRLVAPTDGRAALEARRARFGSQRATRG